MLKPLISKNRRGNIQPIARDGDKDISAVPKGTSPKRNAITRLKFELAYYDATVQDMSRYATEKLPVVVKQT